MSSHPTIRDLTDAEFDRLVLQSERPAVLAFFSPWSPACEIVRQAFGEFAAEVADRADVFRVSVEDSPDTAALYDIRTIPTLLCVFQGRERVRIVGTCNKDTVLQKLLPALKEMSRD